MILKDHNHSLGCYLVICSHQIDYFWEKSRSRLIRWEILTVARVRGDDGLGSGSINNRRERVNGSKNKNRKHFTEKQLCGYKEPSPTEAFTLFLFGVGREGVVYLGAHRERRNPFICIFPNFIRERLPSRDGSDVLPSTRPLIPCINPFFRLHSTSRLGQKRKKKKKTQRSCHFLLRLVMLVFISRFETPVVPIPVLGSTGPPY